MTARELPEKFLVAFSFAGEERDLVRTIAEEVERQLGPSTVFLDEWFEYYIAGDDGDLRLQRIYAEQCEMVVVGVSASYGTKPWTLVEYAAVRALSMTIRVSEVENDKHRVLPIRVGDGDVEGIRFNAIVPEARGKPVIETASLIVNRLGLIIPATKVIQADTNRTWPKEPAAFSHGLADRTVHEWPAVLNLLTSDSPNQILMFHGLSGYSKTALLSAVAKYAKALKAPTAYVDFKDTSLLSEANVCREIQLGLSRLLPGFARQGDPDPWSVRQALRRLQDPALILMDTYEKAAETRDFAEWIETELLAEVEECPTLRFVIGGQKVPSFGQARWDDRAEAIELEAIHDKQVWKDWVSAMNPDVDGKAVEAFVDGFNGVPSTISSTLTILARHQKSSA